MLKIDAFVKENIATLSISFENGKINIKQRSYTSKELMDIFKKYGGKNINPDMVKNIPSQNVVGIMAWSFKPEGIEELIKLTGMDGFVNMILSPQGISLDDIVKSTKGDILLSVTDLQTRKKVSDSTDKERLGADVLFAGSVGDKESFNKVLNTLLKLKDKMKRDSGFGYARNDKYFIFGNVQSLVDKYSAGANNSFPFMDKLKDHPFGIFIDINKILTASSNLPSKDSTDKVLLDASLKVWDNVYVAGGEVENNSVHINTEINMVDKNTNSLKQLNNYFNEIGKAVKEKRKHYKEHWKLEDSTIAAPDTLGRPSY